MRHSVCFRSMAQQRTNNLRPTATTAIFFRDFPVLQGAVVILTIAVMLANLVADVAYAYFDPRIRFA